MSNSRRNSKFKNLFLYGGVSKQEFIASKRLMRQQNIRVWRAALIAVTILELGLLITSLVVPSLKGYAIPFGCLCGLTIISTILMHFAFNEDTKFVDIYFYIYIFTHLFIFIYNSIFVGEYNTISTLGAMLILFALLVVGAPWVSFVIYMPICASYIVFELIYKGDHPVCGNNIANMVVFTLLAIVTVYILDYIRIPSIAARLQVEKERDQDALTKVFNSIAYDRAIKQLNNKIKKDDTSRLALAVFDINYLKNMNDSHGHRAGDMLIISAVNIIKDAFKTSNIYRIGGDEFAVIISGSDFDNKEAITRNLHEKLNALNDKYTGAPEDISIAFGVATYNKRTDTDYVSLFSRADADMYENKRFLKKKLEK